MKSQLLYLGLALLLLICGVVFSQREMPQQDRDVRLAGQTIHAEDPPLQRLDAICELAGRCASGAAMRGSTEFRTTRVAEWQADVLTLTIETERKEDATQVYLIHTLETFSIPLRMIDSAGTRVDDPRAYSAPGTYCESLKVGTIYELRGTIGHQITDLLKGGVDRKTHVVDVHLPFSDREACEAARQAIIDLAEEAMQQATITQSPGRIGQD